MFTGIGGRTKSWPRAVVFDCDGLLVHSQGCWDAAYADAVRSVTTRYRPVDLGALNGASVSSAAAELTRQLGSPVDPDLLRGRLLEHVMCSRSVVAMPGALALVGRLQADTRLAVASNGPEVVVRAMLARAGLDQHLPIVISAENCAAHKPAPDVYLAACAAVETDPSDAVAFEDSVRGASAARRAGMLVVGIGPNAGRDVDLATTRLDHPLVWGFLGLPQH